MEKTTEDTTPKQHDGDSLPGKLNRKMTRAQLLAAAGAGVAVAMLPRSTGAAALGSGYPFFPQVSGTYSTEQPSDISRILHTSEHLAAGVFYTAIGTPSLNLAANPLLLATAQAALVEHQRHAEFMDSIFNPFALIRKAWFVNTDAAPQGFGPAADPVKLSIPSGVLDNAAAFFTAVEWLETLYVGMYTTAIREFAEMGQPEVAKWMAQILGVEGGIATLSRGAQALAGVATAIPPNNKAFETDYLLYVRDAVPALIAKGFFNGPGPELPIFSPAAARTSPFTDVAGPMVTAVIQQTPNNASSTDVTALPGARS